MRKESQHSFATTTGPKMSSVVKPTRFYFQMFTIFSISSSGPHCNPCTALHLPHSAQCKDLSCQQRSLHIGTMKMSWRRENLVSPCIKTPKFCIIPSKREEKVLNTVVFDLLLVQLLVLVKLLVCFTSISVFDY